jgi:hypothetical protein
MGASVAAASAVRQLLQNVGLWAIARVYNARDSRLVNLCLALLLANNRPKFAVCLAVYNGVEAWHTSRRRSASGICGKNEPKTQDTP